MIAFLVALANLALFAAIYVRNNGWLIGLAKSKPAKRTRGIYRMDFGTAYVFAGVQVYVPQSDAAVSATLVARLRKISEEAR